MKWFYLSVWLVFIVCMAISANMHEKKLDAGTTQDRVGFWERLWYGTSCIAIFQFFEAL